MRILDGKSTAQDIKKELSEQVKLRKAEGKKIPHLAAILVGNDGGSMTYVAAKVKACEECGFESTLIRYDDSVSEEVLLKRVKALNEDDSVDGFHPENIGKMVLNLPGFLSATPAGILELLHRNNIVTEGKKCVIIGRSNIVGTPLSIMLTRNSNPGNCTVTLTHSMTKNLNEICQTADILIAAIGQPNFVTADMVKEGAVVIDVGTSRVEDPTKKSGWKLMGDVQFDQVAEKCSFITPVPGGVGPMTIASLMINTLKAMDLKNN